MFNSTTSAPSKLAMVNVLTANLMKHFQISRSEAMSNAWYLVKTGDDFRYLVFRKKQTGEITRRVVSENWTQYQAPKGGTSTLKPTQKVFADMGKYFTDCPNCLISTFPEQIEYFA